MLGVLWITFLLGTLFLLGGAVGSFLNVCIVRLPAGRSLVRPGSCCGHCHKPIRMEDNLPLISYWVLRGRCRACGASFSMRYFWVELLTAVAFVLLYHLEVGWNVHHFDILGDSGYWFLNAGMLPPHTWPLFICHVLLLCFLIVMTLSNQEFHKVPWSVTRAGVLVGLAGAVLFPWPWPDQPERAVRAGDGTPLMIWWKRQPWPGCPPVGAMPAEGPWWMATAVPHCGLYPWPVWGPLPRELPPGSWQLGLATGLAGVLAGAGLLGLVRLSFNAGAGASVLGWGEVSLMAVAGAFLGWQPVVVASLLALLLALPWLIRRWVVTRKQEMSYSPWLALTLAPVWLGWYWVGPLVQGLFFNAERLLLLAGVCGLALLALALCLRLLRPSGAVPVDNQLS